MLCENCIVDVSIFIFLCVVFFVACKGAWWMPWHAEPMKDVEGRDRPRGVVNRALIRGCPNGETWPVSLLVTHC